MVCGTQTKQIFWSKRKCQHSLGINHYGAQNDVKCGKLPWFIAFLNLLCFSWTNNLYSMFWNCNLWSHLKMNTFCNLFSNFQVKPKSLEIVWTLVHLRAIIHQRNWTILLGLYTLTTAINSTVKMFQHRNETSFKHIFSIICLCLCPIFNISSILKWLIRANNYLMAGMCQNTNINT